MSDASVRLASSLQSPDGRLPSELLTTSFSVFGVSVPPVPGSSKVEAAGLLSKAAKWSTVEEFTRISSTMVAKGSACVDVIVPRAHSRHEETAVGPICVDVFEAVCADFNLNGRCRSMICLKPGWLTA